VGVLNPAKAPGKNEEPSYLFSVKVPYLLSVLANRNPQSFVPGINDLLYGNSDKGVQGVSEKMIRGRNAVTELAAYKKARKEGDERAAAAALQEFNQSRAYLGYGYLRSPEDAVPPVAINFYSFRLMVTLGLLFGLTFVVYLFFALRDTLAGKRWLLRFGVLSLFLGYIASEAGWVVAEVGRQPWAIQGLLPVGVASTGLAPASVQTTFFVFLILFTTLLVAEVRIMLKQITIGPEEK
jgi:cytochrome d ubiquinol oxidase subunit I